MKKITLVVFLLTFGLQAQDFPNPYCDIDPDGTGVEEITSVTFNETNITNDDIISILIDKTSNAINLNQGETYTIEVQGNTYGEFDNDIVAFIDWNHNELLDDTNEIYEIGTLTNSTGEDGVAISMEITVPEDALTGQTRIRITKTYTDEESPAIINPCAIEFDAFGQGNFPGFGQALDFSLNIETLSTERFDTNALSVYPIPAKDILNVKYKSSINSIKIFSLLGQEVFAKNIETDEYQLNISSFNSGVYIVKLYTADGSHSLKIIKE
ncbi:T9SS type A sorting domain-containing protein [Psychroflexus montanilacus]|uniref:T9SS type A sorting domain-containing protein n=1 Tax=Psychroflexus montanilacus TaxID=2873598 RepID=UPI001CCF91CD|nr:T9SS type A sorting domain-containing protein [Psychroflexus montanilacus]MBZ9652585.1 T9SS type A sorting domain-containing protein [Psychroflexus montanilacus]